MGVLGNKINPGGQETSRIRRHTPALGSSVSKPTAQVSTNRKDKSGQRSVNPVLECFPGAFWCESLPFVRGKVLCLALEPFLLLLGLSVMSW